ncbi:MAG: OmpA family protein [Bernardetiaceae bacterium]|nr:OmpA family protein [Bernardetiaceae bacterium]
MYRAFSLFFLCFFALNICAQPADRTKAKPFVLDIQFVDATTGEPVVGADVEIRNLSDTTDYVRAVTVTSGKTFKRLRDNQQYLIKAKHRKYFTTEPFLIHTADSVEEKLRGAILMREIVLGVAQRIEGVAFYPNSEDYMASSLTEFAELINMLRNYPQIKIEIACHTDSRGNANYNLEISQKRAEKLRDYLREQGIADERIVPKGYGETRLINHCEEGVKCSNAEHEQNRRVEYMIIAVE